MNSIDKEDLLMKKILLVASTALLALSPVLADTAITLNGANYTVPDEVANIYNANKIAIDSAIQNVSAADIANVINAINSGYAIAAPKLGTLMPYTTSVNGLNEFTDILCDTIPNTQAQQHVWAKAWIGNLLPKPNFGLGINAGVASMDVSPLTRTAKSLGMDTGGVPDTLAFPTLTADARVGGILLPFDVGVVVSTIDTSKMGLDSKLDPMSFNYFTIGGDIRYAILKLPLFQTRISVGAGAYYTKGSVEANDSKYADAKLDFNTTTLMASTQASAKFLVFVPFVGGKLMVSKSNVDWSVSKIQWANILGSANSEYINQAVAWGLLPSKFSGGSKTDYSDNVRPILFGGIGLDIPFFDLTMSASYDFMSEIAGAAVSLRFAL